MRRWHGLRGTQTLYVSVSFEKPTRESYTSTCPWEGRFILYEGEWPRNPAPSHCCAAGQGTPAASAERGLVEEPGGPCTAASGALGKPPAPGVVKLASGGF